MEQSEVQNNNPASGTESDPGQAQQKARETMDQRTAALEAQAKALDGGSGELLQSLARARQAFEQKYETDLAKAQEDLDRALGEIQDDLVQSLTREGLLNPESKREAGEKNNSEAIRIREEMKNLAKRNLYKGVVENYEHLQALAKKGVDLKADDHLLAATSFMGLGQVDGAKSALVKALQLDPTRKDLVDFLDSINRDYVEVEFTGGKDSSFAAVEMPFDPTQRRAIEHAQSLLQESGRFSGLLPMGDYTLNQERIALNHDATAVPAPQMEEKSAVALNERRMGSQDKRSERKREALTPQEQARLDAEVARLSGEIFAQIGREASGKMVSWRAVESNYESAMDLIEQGAQFKYREQDLHLAASEAALQRGDVKAAELRLSRASQLGDNEKIQAQRAKLADEKIG